MLKTVKEITYIGDRLITVILDDGYEIQLDSMETNKFRDLHAEQDELFRNKIKSKLKYDCQKRQAVLHLIN